MMYPLLVIVCFTSSAFADRTNLKIYTHLMANNFCFRRLNATDQIGCSSSISGDVGIVYVVDNATDFDWVTGFGPDAPYIAALSQPFFNFGNLTKLKDSKRVSGVIVLQENSSSISTEGFSPDDSCPNRNFGLYTDTHNPEYASCKKGIWNPGNPALGMAFVDWGMPVFLISKDADIKNIRENCFEKFNKPLEDGTLRSWPLCACQLSSPMFAAKDSPTCMRRSSMIPSLTHTTPFRLCDPLSGKNIVSTLFPTNSSSGDLEDRSVIVVAARMDSFSMFEPISPGADSSITGLVTLLSVANALTQIKDEIQNKTHKNVLFAIFNGEAFGYIGSSRIVFDMERGEFPQAPNPKYMQPAQISLRHISHFIEVGQLASPELWIHTDPVSTNANRTVERQVDEMIKKMQKHADQEAKVSPADRPLPPSSFQSFLRYDLNISGIVITAFNKTFNNVFYNSMFDTLGNLGYSREDLAKRLANISQIVSSTVRDLLVDNLDDDATQKVNIDNNLIDKMLHCYLENSSCELFQEIVAPSKIPGSDPVPTYVSVGVHGALSFYTSYLMAFLTGNRMSGYVSGNCTSEDNDRIFSYIFMPAHNSGICVKSTVMTTLALSPASELNDWESSEYSTWTESIWQLTSVTIFLHPSRAHEGLVLGIGVFVVVLSFLTVYYVNKRAAILFGVRGLIGC